MREIISTLSLINGDLESDRLKKHKYTPKTIIIYHILVSKIQCPFLDDLSTTMTHKKHLYAFGGVEGTPLSKLFSMH